MKHKVIAKVLVINEAGEVLCLRRSRHDDARPGGWDFPGGNVETDERIVAAVVRETEEEAGLHIRNPYMVYGRGMVLGPQYTAAWLGFVERTTGRPTVRLSDEHDHYEWLTPAALLAQNSYEHHHSLFAYLQHNDLFKKEGAQIASVTARVLIINTTGKVLIIRRSATDPLHAGAWDLPGGRVDAGEDVCDAALRETEEEVGLRLQAPRIVFANSASRQQGGSGTWVFFAEHVSDGVSLTLGDEHEAIKWIAPTVLSKYTDYPVLLQMIDFVTKHHLLTRM
ncbi:MAG TPA: NUDIX hydrolase [Candidatus Saccharimonadales bacterium]|nr:NUDIX hydrolase [Candidatus Saccharimonadales bacterium]